MGLWEGKKKQDEEEGETTEEAFRSVLPCPLPGILEVFEIENRKGYALLGYYSWIRLLGARRSFIQPNRDATSPSRLQHRFPFVEKLRHQSLYSESIYTSPAASSQVTEAPREGGGEESLDEDEEKKFVTWEPRSSRQTV